MKHLGGEVATERSPSGAIESRAYVMLVTVDDGSSREGLGAVGENGAVLYEGLVGERTVGDEYGAMRTDREGDHGPIFGMKSSKDGFEL